MADPTNLILTLKACTRLTEEAFSLSHNSKRYVPPSSNAPTDISSRQSTPSVEDGGIKAADSSYHWLRLAFDPPPKDMTLGFVFGSHQDSDILLGKREIGISGRHFCIMFDEQRRILLKDLSRCGTRVSYNGQGRNQLRSVGNKHRRDSFTWILFDGFFFNGSHAIEVIPGPPSEDGYEPFKFLVYVELHEKCKAEYLACVDSFLGESRKAIPQIDQLDSQNNTAVPTETLDPEQWQQLPIYAYIRVVGRGQFGVVYEVINVSTGSVYAGKEFYRLNQMTDREVGVVKSVSHDHIVRFVDFTNELRPLLVMEYLRFGNLENQHGASRLTEEEMVQVLNQVLSALDYLHGQGYAHRDIKPENILVKSRSPFIIKLGDFGLAREDTDFLTLCGIAKYMALEIWGRDDGFGKLCIERPYTHVVDIWSLGVIILEYVYGLPHSSHWGTYGWHNEVIKSMDDWESQDALMLLLKTKMLRMDPRERLSASRCLEVVIILGLLDEPTDESGSTTPTARSSPHKFKEGNDGNPTTITGPHWASHQFDDSSIKSSKRNLVSSGDRPTKKVATDDQVSWTMGYEIEKGRLRLRLEWPTWEVFDDECEGLEDKRNECMGFKDDLAGCSFDI
ncbi:MAG: hypothetical protein M1840_002756 [Geoglossum simile]|nr:MAG: hypothetical protein M1840_002756 [Geoglossum simile]